MLFVYLHFIFTVQCYLVYQAWKMKQLGTLSDISNRLYIVVFLSLLILDLKVKDVHMNT